MRLTGHRRGNPAVRYMIEQTSRRRMWSAVSHENGSVYISVETLAEKIESINEVNGGFSQDWKIGGDDIKIKIEKVSI